MFIATNILQKKNYQQLPDVVKLASELGVVKLNVNGLEPYKEDMIDNIMWLPGHFKRFARCIGRDNKSCKKRTFNRFYKHCAKDLFVIMLLVH